MKTAKNVALLDYGLLVLTATLIGIGFIMIFSSSYQQSVMRFELSPTYFAQRQLQWIVVGTVAMLACALVNYHLLERYATPLLGTILLLLVAVLLFGGDEGVHLIDAHQAGSVGREGKLEAADGVALDDVAGEGGGFING